MRITRTLTTAIAVAALVAPAAQARPADPPDMHTSVAVAAAQERQAQQQGAGPRAWPDMHASVAQAAADAREQRERAARPLDDERSGGEASGRASGVRWDAIGRGVLAVLLAAGGFALVANYRTQRLRAGA